MSFLKFPPNPILRFADALFPSANESAQHNLSCGRIDWGETISAQYRRPVWIRQDPFCDLRWTREGMTCVCNTTGTFALLKSWKVYEVSWNKCIF